MRGQSLLRLCQDGVLLDGLHGLHTLPRAEDGLHGLHGVVVLPKLVEDFRASKRAFQPEVPSQVKVSSSVSESRVPIEASK